MELVSWASSSLWSPWHLLRTLFMVLKLVSQDFKVPSHCYDCVCLQGRAARVYIEKKKQWGQLPTYSLETRVTLAKEKCSLIWVLGACLIVTAIAVTAALELSRDWEEKQQKKRRRKKILTGSSPFSLTLRIPLLEMFLFTFIAEPQVRLPLS